MTKTMKRIKLEHQGNDDVEMAFSSDNSEGFFFLLDNKTYDMLNKSSKLVDGKNNRTLSWLKIFFSNIVWQPERPIIIKDDGVRVSYIPDSPFKKQTGIQALGSLVDRSLFLTNPNGIREALFCYTILDTPNCDQKLQRLAAITLKEMDDGWTFDEQEKGKYVSKLFGGAPRRLILNCAQKGYAAPRKIVNALLASLQVEVVMRILKNKAQLTCEEVVAWVHNFNKGEISHRRCAMCALDVFTELFVAEDSTNCVNCEVVSNTPESTVAQKVLKTLNLKWDSSVSLNRKDRVTLYIYDPTTSCNKIEGVHPKSKRIGCIESADETRTETTTKCKKVFLMCARCLEEYPVFNCKKVPSDTKYFKCPKCNIIQKIYSSSEFRLVLQIYLQCLDDLNDISVSEIWFLYYFRSWIIDSLKTTPFGNTDDFQSTESTEDKLFKTSFGNTESIPVDFRFNKVFKAVSVFRPSTDLPLLPMKQYSQKSYDQLVKANDIDDLIRLQTGRKDISLLDGEWTKVSQLPDTASDLFREIVQTQQDYTRNEMEQILECGAFATKFESELRVEELFGRSVKHAKEVVFADRDCMVCRSGCGRKVLLSHCSRIICTDCLEKYTKIKSVSGDTVIINYECTFCHKGIWVVERLKNGKEYVEVPNGQSVTALQAPMYFDDDDFCENCGELYCYT